MNEYRQIEAGEISDLLDELLRRCTEHGISADVYLVGGAALTIQLGRPRATPDFDVLLNPKDEILSVARGMAKEMDLDPEWVNSRAFAFLAGMDADLDVEAKQLPIEGHRVRVASPRYLLAMKLAAGREKDIDDAAACVRALGFPSSDQILDDAIRILGEDSVAWSAPHNEDLREWIRPDVEYVLRAARNGAGQWIQPGTAKAPTKAAQAHLARFPELRGMKLDPHGLSDTAQAAPTESDDRQR